MTSLQAGGGTAYTNVWQAGGPPTPMSGRQGPPTPLSGRRGPPTPLLLLDLDNYLISTSVLSIAACPGQYKRAKYNPDGLPAEFHIN